MIRKVAIDVPVFQVDQFAKIVAVEKNSITPGGCSFVVITLLLFDVFISGHEVYCWLAVHTQSSCAVVEMILVFLKKSGEIGLHI